MTDLNENTIADAEAKTDSLVERPPNRRQKATALSLACGAFLTVYILSAGPMAALHRAVKFKPLQNGLEIFYAPVVLLTKAGLWPLSDLLKWYISLFR